MGEEPNTAHSQHHGKPKARWKVWRDSIGFWVGIAAFVLSFYFYYASDKKPWLVYAVSPAKAELRRPDFDNKLQIEYGGVHVDSDVTIAQVQIWNAGTRSIRATDILQPLTLQMGDNVPILSARIKQTTRDVCAFTFDNGQLAVSQKPVSTWRFPSPARAVQEGKLLTDPNLSKGECTFNFKILEPGDGAIVQIIYEGDASKEPTISGIFEGQRAVESVRPQSGHSGKPQNAYLIGLIAGAILGLLHPFGSRKTRSEKILRLLRLLLVCVVGVLGFLVFMSEPPPTPFSW